MKLLCFLRIIEYQVVFFNVDRYIFKWTHIVCMCIVSVSNTEEQLKQYIIHVNYGGN